MLKLFKFLFGLLLVPACMAVTLTVYHLFLALKINGTDDLSLSAWGLVIGFFLWLILYFALPRPMRTYVLAHELSHAIWAWAFGAKISGMKVSGKGGHVKVSKTNVLITLAPYFFPLYTVLTILAYLGLSVFLDMRTYEPFWMGLVGLTWSFHLTFTLSTLRVIQPDVTEHGRLFSYTFIYIMNILGLALWIVAIGSPGLEQMIDQLGSDGVLVYTWCRDAVLSLR